MADPRELFRPHENGDILGEKRRHIFFNNISSVCGYVVILALMEVLSKGSIIFLHYIFDSN